MARADASGDGAGVAVGAVVGDAVGMAVGATVLATVLVAAATVPDPASEADERPHPERISAIAAKKIRGKKSRLDFDMGERVSGRCLGRKASRPHPPKPYFTRKASGKKISYQPITHSLIPNKKRASTLNPARK
jgi:hypothetical protein